MAIVTMNRGPGSRALWERFQEDWDQLFGWSRFPETSGLFDRSVTPTLDVVETEEEVTVWADLPGVDRKDLELSVTANVLTIKGEKRGEDSSEQSRERVYRDETWSGSFQRSLALPDSADTEKVNAEFRDGVLRIDITKRAEHKPRQIAVTAR